MGSAACCFSSSRSRTPSRRNNAVVPGVLAALLLLGAGARAEAADAAEAPAVGTRSVRADSIPRRSRPVYVMLRSAVVPGWGQLYNRKVLKAAGVVAGEGLLAYQALSEHKKENEAVDRLSALLDAGVGPGDPAYQAVDQDREAHRNRKINWIWWGVAAHLLSMV